MGEVGRDGSMRCTVIAYTSMTNACTAKQRGQLLFFLEVVFFLSKGTKHVQNICSVFS